MVKRRLSKNTSVTKDVQKSFEEIRREFKSVKNKREARKLLVETNKLLLKLSVMRRSEKRTTLKRALGGLKSQLNQMLKAKSPTSYRLEKIELVEKARRNRKLKPVDTKNIVEKTLEQEKQEGTYHKSVRDAIRERERQYKKSRFLQLVKKELQPELSRITIEQAIKLTNEYFESRGIDTEVREEYIQYHPTIQIIDYNIKETRTDFIIDVVYVVTNNVLEFYKGEKRVYISKRRVKGWKIQTK